MNNHEVHEDKSHIILRELRVLRGKDFSVKA
jgi:hypothetical protein